MPYRDWRSYLAVGGWLTAVVAGALAGYPWEARNEPPYTQGVAGANPAHHGQPNGDGGGRRDDAQDSQPDAPIKAGAIEAPPANQCGPGEDQSACQRAVEDVDAQKRMARAAEWLTWFTLGQLITGFLGTVIVAFTLTYAIKATREARKAAIASQQSADTAERALYASERPWVTLKVAPTGPFVMTESGTLPVEVTIANIGKSPALNVTFEVVLHPTIEDSRQRLERMIDQNTHTAPLGVDLFPSEEIPYVHILQIAKADLEHNAFAFGGADRYIYPMIIGVAVYKSAIREKNRFNTTGIMLNVIRIDKINAKLPPEIFDIAPGEFDVWLRKSPISGKID